MVHVFSERQQHEAVRFVQHHQLDMLQNKMSAVDQCSQAARCADCNVTRPARRPGSNPAYTLSKWPSFSTVSLHLAPIYANALRQFEKILAKFFVCQSMPSSAAALAGYGRLAHNSHFRPVTPPLPSSLFNLSYNLVRRNGCNKMCLAPT